MWDRDAAYHNGTVWPWPMGAFIEAWLKTHNHSPEAIKQAKDWLQPLITHLDNTGCIGQISEVFDAAEPQRPAGCFAQAWSVAEVLRGGSYTGCKTKSPSITQTTTARHPASSSPPDPARQVTGGVARRHE